MGEFFVNAEYGENKKVTRLAVHLITDGIVGPDAGYDLSELNGLVEKIEKIIVEET